jgi:hypothetical protein
MFIRDVKLCSQEILQHTILERILTNMLQLYLWIRCSNTNFKETMMIIYRIETCLCICKGLYLLGGYDRGLLDKASLYIRSRTLWRWYISTYVYVYDHYPSSSLCLKTQSSFSFKTQRFGDCILRNVLFWNINRTVL